MDHTETRRRWVLASLGGLLALNLIMLGSLFSQVPPCPPGEVGPYIGATAALAVVALPLVWWRTNGGTLAAVLVALLCFRSLGPLNFLTEPDPKPMLLAPVLIPGTILSLVVLIGSLSIPFLNRPRKEA